MSNELYNIIIHSNHEFWSGSDPYVDFSRDRFLEYTTDDIKNQFQPLNQSMINRLKELPTLFAVEQECVETKIGKVTRIQVYDNILRVHYQFPKDKYPLARGILEKNRHKLRIEKLELYRTHCAIKEGDISGFYKEYLKTLIGIAHQLKASNKNVQLIYAFNGTGKTRLSREFKEIVSSKIEEEGVKDRYTKVLYYNAFTEDLFYWDNDIEHKLKIQPNNYTQWVLQEQGQDQNAIAHFQRYTSDKLTPHFSPDFSEVTFSFERGNDEYIKNIKISKGEESNFIWSIFYSLLEQIINVLNVSDASERETDRYDQLEYVFIDDPVTSLDENHLIGLAVDLAELIKLAPPDLKFIITTHSPLFYNILHNELGLNKRGKKDDCYLLEKLEDGTYNLSEKLGDSNRSFSYHLYLKQILEKAVAENQIQKYHFQLLRNLYEKTAAFLGYQKWSDLLPGDKEVYVKRIINFNNHSTLSNEAVAEPTQAEKQIIKYLLDNLTDNYSYWSEKEEVNA